MRKCYFITSRCCFISLIAFGCSGDPSAPGVPLEPIELWIYGQSNAVSPANAATPVYSATGRVLVNDFYCEWVTGEVGCYQGSQMVLTTASHTIRSNQAWILLGDELHRPTGRDVRVYQFAMGDKTTRLLRQEWLFAAAKQALRDHPAICAALWIQGEAEVGFPVEETVDNMRTIVNETRAIHPELPWFVALDGGARPAQFQLIAEGLVGRGPDIDSLRVARPEFFEVPNPAEFVGRSGHQAHADGWLRVLRAARLCGTSSFPTF